MSAAACYEDGWFGRHFWVCLGDVVCGKMQGKVWGKKKGRPEFRSIFGFLRILGV